MNVNFSGAQSPTLFNTNSSGSNGIFMFANDGGVQFTNMAAFDPTDYTGSVGAVNAIAATAGANSLPTVQIVNSVTGQTLQTLTNVFPSGYSGGVQVAIGNVIAGSGIPDLIVAAGVGQAPFIKVYSVLTGALIESFLAQSSAYNYGLQVAVGDVTGDGLQDIIAAPLVGAATVYVFKNTGSTTTPFTAYSATTPTFHRLHQHRGLRGRRGRAGRGQRDRQPGHARQCQWGRRHHRRIGHRHAGNSAGFQLLLEPRQSDACQDDHCRRFRRATWAGSVWPWPTSTATVFPTW